ncbi:MAG: TonB-dependent receptor plug domain-containing protein [Rhodocyclaceae bacterium]|nr:TonB-dependent receptor plug domain-containing protein [Rhodocyclaceae bacterium]
MHSKTLALASRQPTPPLFRFVPLALILASAFPAQADVVLPEVEVRSTAADDPANPKVRSVSTATKTSTPPKYVPQSIDSVSVERALDYGQNTMAAALSGVAGVNNASDTRFDNFVIRGFTSSADLFLDGIRDDAQYVRDLSNVERIEVLKGPGAVLYGRGSGGGVINRISKQPKDESFGKVNLRAGSYGVRGASVDLNRVINEEWSARLNLNEESADSFRQFVDVLISQELSKDNSFEYEVYNFKNCRFPCAVLTNEDVQPIIKGDLGCLINVLDVGKAQNIRNL